MDIPGPEIDDLKRAIASLTARVNALERAADRKLQPPAQPAPPSPAASAASSPSKTSATPSPSAPPPRSVSAPPFLSALSASAGGRGDLESRIGGQWLNRIGIVAVLIGVSYFLQYAFENGWIGPSGRIAIGLLAGIAVIIWSERFRRRGYRLFSFSLKAIGIGTLYLSLWGAYQVYHLVPASAAFAAMILVTASTGMLAVRQDAEIIAAFAIAGGFATPLLLSTGQNHELVLFSYVGLLDLATLALVALRPWKRLLGMGFLGTVVLYVGWFAAFYDKTQLSPTLAFASFFFIIFALAPRLCPAEVDDAANSETNTALIFIGLSLSNPITFFLQLFAMLDYLPSHDRDNQLAWAALAIAAVYLFLAREIRQRSSALSKSASRLLPLLYLAVAIGFITIAVPLKLNAHWITIGWLVEAAVLLAISERAGNWLLLYMGGGAVTLGVVRLLLIDNFYSQHLVFNARFATYGVAVAVLAGIAAKSADSESRATVHRAAVIALNVLALLALTHEVSDYFARRMSVYAVVYPQQWLGRGEYRELSIIRDFSYSALWMLYGFALMAVGFIRRSPFLRWIALVLTGLTVIKVFIFDVSALDRGYRIASFIFLGVLLLAISFAYQRKWLNLSGSSSPAPQPDLAKGNSA